MNNKYQLVHESLIVNEGGMVNGMNPEDAQILKTAQEAIKTGAMGLGVVAAALAFGAGLLVAIIWAFKKIFSRAKTPEQQEQMKQQMINKIEAAKQKALSDPKNAKRQAQIIANATKLQSQIKGM